MGTKKKIQQLVKHIPSPLIGAATHFEKYLQFTLPAPILCDMHPDMVRDGAAVARRAAKLPATRSNAKSAKRTIRNATRGHAKKLTARNGIAPKAKKKFIPALPTNTNAYRNASVAGNFLVKPQNAPAQLIQIVTVADKRNYIASHRNIRQALEIYFDRNSNISQAEQAARWLAAAVAELDAKYSMQIGEMPQDNVTEMGMNAIFFDIEYFEELKSEYWEEYRACVERFVQVPNAHAEFEYKWGMEQAWKMQQLQELDELNAVLERIDREREQSIKAAQRAKELLDYEEWVESQFERGRHWVR